MRVMVASFSRKYFAGPSMRRYIISCCSIMGRMNPFMGSDLLT